MVYQVDISECYKCFDKCHTIILKKFGGSSNIVILAEKQKISPISLIIEFWKKTFNVTPIRSKGCSVFDKLQFESKHHYLLWKLKWSEQC
jgi:hypothetical protein